MSERQDSNEGGPALQHIVSIQHHCLKLLKWPWRLNERPTTVTGASPWNHNVV